jgi:hypothetical protein
MFDPIEIPSLSSWWWRFLAQFFLCYPATWIVGSLLSSLLSLIGLGNHGRIQFLGYDGIVLLCLASLAGWAMGGAEPTLRSSGQWIWVVPVLAFVGDLVADLRRPIPWPAESLFTTPGEGVIGPYLIGLPAFTAAGYSVGIALFSRRSRIQRFGEKNVLAAAALVVVLLGLVSYAFENARMERWSTIRYAAAPRGEGVPLATDRQTLCRSQTGDSWITSEYIELTGERQACEGDQVLQPGESGPPQSFIVDRVKLLTGPNAGKQGWALEYALLNPIQ